MSGHIWDTTACDDDADIMNRRNCVVAQILFCVILEVVISN